MHLFPNNKFAMNLLIKISGLLLILFISACQSPLLSNDSSRNNNVLTNWSMTGNIAVIYSDDNCRTEICHKKSEQGGISWRQSGNDYEIAIADPFGRVLSVLKGDSDKAKLVRGEKVYYINNVQDYIAKTLKVNVAINSITYWIQGKADVNFPVNYLNSNQFVQQGFTISADSYKKYNATSNKADSEIKLPTFIIISNAKSKLKIAINNWIVK